MMHRPQHPPVPQKTCLVREDVASKLLGTFCHSRVLVIGIGGGGDVVGALPTCFDLERLGAEVIPAGLTWKRMVHDRYGRPRPISLFNNVTQINDFIGEANPQTCPKDSSPHIEARVSAALGGKPVAMIDLSAGSRAVTNALRDYQEKRKIDHIIGVDAGGDVLCLGSEPALESPICDQTLLSALVQLKSSALGVFGFGSDGEMSIEAMKARVRELGRAFQGALPINSVDIAPMNKILETAPTEASKLPMRIVAGLRPERLTELLQQLNAPVPNLDGATENQTTVQMRTGSRVATLSDLSATTLFFDPAAIFSTSQFPALLSPDANIDEIAQILREANIGTEFNQREDRERE